MRWLAIPVVVAAVATAAPGQVEPKPKSPSIPADATADQVATDVLANELRAEELYLDKDVTVRGKVARVLRSRAPVDERGQDAFAVELQLTKAKSDEIVVRFFFNRDDRDRLAKLLPGSEVVLRGHGARFLVYPDEQKRGKELIEVQFRDSRVIEVKAPATPERDR
ncbi:MAG TPA: hypothetical protein VKE40_19390 [Gemmataceae bacterium]|nr:hypothetical protein [Gemmataceae bacterium]